MGEHSQFNKKNISFCDLVLTPTLSEGIPESLNAGEIF